MGDQERISRGVGVIQDSTTGKISWLVFSSPISLSLCHTFLFLVHDESAPGLFLFYENCIGML